MQKSTSFKKIISNLVVFGLYFVFLFTQVNYIYINKPAVLKNEVWSFTHYQVNKKHSDLHASKRTKNTTSSVTLSKRYFPKGLYEVSDIQFCIAATFQITSNEIISVSTSPCIMLPRQHNKRGPPVHDNGFFLS
jgi:hypothetical protein